MIIERVVFEFEGNIYTRWTDDMRINYYHLEENESMDILGIKTGDIEVNPSLIKQGTFIQGGGVTTFLTISVLPPIHRSWPIISWDELVVATSQGDNFKSRVHGQIANTRFICVMFPDSLASVLNLSLIVHSRPQDIRLKHNSEMFE